MRFCGSSHVFPRFSLSRACVHYSSVRRNPRRQPTLLSLSEPTLSTGCITWCEVRWATHKKGGKELRKGTSIIFPSWNKIFKTTHKPHSSLLQFILGHGLPHVLVSSLQSSLFIKPWESLLSKFAQSARPPEAAQRICSMYGILTNQFYPLVN